MYEYILIKTAHTLFTLSDCHTCILISLLSQLMTDYCIMLNCWGWTDETDIWEWTDETDVWEEADETDCWWCEKWDWVCKIDDSERLIHILLYSCLSHLSVDDADDFSISSSSSLTSSSLFSSDDITMSFSAECWCSTQHFERDRERVENQFSSALNLHHLKLLYWLKELL